MAVAAMTKTTPHPARILVIDDERFIAELMRDVLRRHGHEVEMCADGASAVQCAETGTFDLVITDFAMPGLSGLTLAQRVRAKDPQAKVVIVSAYLDGETLDALEREPNYVGHLKKPFDIFALTALADRVLAERVPGEKRAAATSSQSVAQPSPTHANAAPPRRQLPFQGGFHGAS
jgi:DNA-binding NtrC family response regulator